MPSPSSLSYPLPVSTSAIHATCCSLRQAQWSYLAQNRRYLRKPTARHVSADPATHMATLPCTTLRRRGGSTELFNQAKNIRISVVFLKKVIRLPIGFH